MTKEQMTAKEYLEEYLDLLAMSEQYKNHAQELFERVTSISCKPQESGMSIQRQSDPKSGEEKLACLVDIEMLSQDYAKQAIKRLKEINSTIKVLNKSEKRVILFVYVSGMSIMDTADKLNYSDSHMSRIHMAALQKLGESITNFQNMMDDAA